MQIVAYSSLSTFLIFVCSWLTSWCSLEMQTQVPPWLSLSSNGVVESCSSLFVSDMPPVLMVKHYYRLRYHCHHFHCRSDRSDGVILPPLVGPVARPPKEGNRQLKPLPNHRCSNASGVELHHRMKSWADWDMCYGRRPYSVSYFPTTHNTVASTSPLRALLHLRLDYLT
jgi:hypothetical protein